MRTAESMNLLNNFWDVLLERAKQKGLALHTKCLPPEKTDCWCSAEAKEGSGVWFAYQRWLDRNMTAVDVYIDTGDKQENKRIFDELHKRKREIERAFGSPLAWDRLEEKSPCRIRSERAKGGVRDGRWLPIQDDMIAAMERLTNAFRPHLAEP
jgi:hypothetical protein